jgi:hypothetical protein
MFRTLNIILSSGQKKSSKDEVVTDQQGLGFSKRSDIVLNDHQF